MTRKLHCWKGKREHVEEKYGWGSDEYWATYGDVDETCMLPLGHDGPHQFTRDDMIGVIFDRVQGEV